MIYFPVNNPSAINPLSGLCLNPEQPNFTNINLVAQEQIEQCQAALEHNLMELNKSLKKDYHVYAIERTVCQFEVRKVKIVLLNKTYIQLNPEKVSETFRNQDFVAFKKVDSTNKFKAKLTPKLFHEIENQQIKHIKIKDDNFNKQVVDLKDIKITQFSEEEVSSIQKYVCAAVENVQYIKYLEQQKQEIESNRNKDSKEAESRQNQLQTERLIQRFQDFLRRLTNATPKKEFFNESQINDEVIAQIIQKNNEKAREEKRVEFEDQRREMILRQEIKKTELRLEVLKS